MDADSEATADMEEAEAAGEPAAVDQPQHPVPLPATAAAAYMPDVSVSVPASTRDMDYEADDDDDGAETESDGEQKAFAAVQAHAAMRASKPPNRRSRASSPDWQEAPTLEDRRLTARQRARLEKEAGLAEDVQWHEMAMPPELAYTWKGKGNKAPSQMTEEEWLKRQEGLERRRMRSLRDKREAEETIKAKLRKAVTARFRGKLGGGAGGGEGSGTEGEAGGGTRGTAGQESLIQPGWVKLRHTGDGCSIAWHANAHPLSYPMAVAAPGSYPPDAVELPLQPPADAQKFQGSSRLSQVIRAGNMQAVQLLHPNELAAAAVEAHARIQGHVLCTNLMHSHWLSSMGDCSAYLKLESEQHTNSFKVRGALNKILSMPDEQIRQGLVTCSTGNHALAFVYACSRSAAASQAHSTIYLPTTASPAKVAKLRAQGGNVVQFGEDCVDAERQARSVAQQQGSTYISPYNDWHIMAGQGSIAVEMLAQIPHGSKLDVCIVPVGGGGLIAGVAAVLKAAHPGCVVVGAQPAASDVMRQSVAAGSIVDVPSWETLSDATAGGIEEGAITLQPCQQYVDRWLTVSEQEIADAVFSLLQHHSKLVEGAAGCGLAAFRQLAQAGELQGKQVAVVCCGGNIAVPVLQSVLQTGVMWS
ncbi:hypothetical protein OEZ85_011886 [Tetradesmus obliquus]|uniref:Tryptophan synthase beta chain-like PALP domain-containing protein n=1 Tax=Tetradesmus obliquus TaxID=3088 RepID=A0ABY8TSF8_TETOB|nr:hypothetical protein OEZ85_011886 [Tetradesmus obliquus]